MGDVMNWLKLSDAVLIDEEIFVTVGPSHPEAETQTEADRDRLADTKTEEDRSRRNRSGRGRSGVTAVNGIA